MKIYKSQSFIHKIEVNLANISVNPDDEFQLVKAYYDIHGFDCELCGHKDCAYAFEVKNLKTNTIIKVGSECIDHFSGRGVDINLAEGLMKRVMSASNKARRDLKRRLGEEAWNKLPTDERKVVRSWQQREFIDKLGAEAYKNIPADEKRELVLTEFITLQTKELLTDVAHNKSILSDEDIQVIMQLGLESEMNRALTTAETARRYKQIKDIENKFSQYIRTDDFSEDVARSMIQDIKNIDSKYSLAWLENNISNVISRRQNLIALHEKYGWLLDYQGHDATIISIKHYLSTYGYISQRQEESAHNLIDAKAHN